MRDFIFLDTFYLLVTLVFHVGKVTRLKMPLFTVSWFVYWTFSLCARYISGTGRCDFDKVFYIEFAWLDFFSFSLMFFMLTIFMLHLEMFFPSNLFALTLFSYVSFFCAQLTFSRNFVECFISLEGLFLVFILMVAKSCRLGSDVLERYFFFNVIGSLFLFFSISQNFTWEYTSLIGHSKDFSALLGFMLLLSFFIKVGLYPLNFPYYQLIVELPTFLVAFLEATYKFFVLTAFVKLFSFMGISITYEHLGFLLMSIVFSSTVSIKDKKIRGAIVLLSMMNVSTISLLLLAQNEVLVFAGKLTSVFYFWIVHSTWLKFAWIEAFSNELDDLNRVDLNVSTGELLFSVFVLSSLPPAPVFFIKLFMIFYLFLHGFSFLALTLILVNIPLSLNYVRLLRQAIK